MNKGKISVVLACLNEEKYIANALKTVLCMDYPQELIEILVVDGDSSDRTLEIVNEFVLKHKNIRVFNNKKVISPVAFNIGIKNATGEYVILMSAHSKYEKNYFKILVEKIIEFNADLIGGCSITKTISDTKTSNSIIKAMTHKIGLGGAKVRVGVTKAEKVDTVTGMFKRSVFDEIGFFNEKLIRNQDMELSKRILANGGSIYIIPDVNFTYYARDNFKDLWNNNFSNGKWIPLTVYYTKNFKSLSIRHFVPVMFVLSLVVPLVLSFFSTFFILISMLSFITYLSLIAYVSIGLNNKKTSFYHLFVSFITLHISYGIGSIVGVFSVLKLVLKGIK